MTPKCPGGHHVIHNLCRVLIVKKKKKVSFTNLLDEAVKIVSFIKSHSCIDVFLICWVTYWEADIKRDCCMRWLSHLYSGLRCWAKSSLVPVTRLLLTNFGYGDLSIWQIILLKMNEVSQLPPRKILTVFVPIIKFEPSSENENFEKLLSTTESLTASQCLKTFWWDRQW